MKRLVLVLSIAVMAALLMFGCKGEKSASPTDVVNSYYQNIKDGKIEKALSYTDKTDDEIKTEAAKFEGFQIKLNEYKIVSEEISEDGQSAKVKEKSKSGAVYRMDLQAEDTIVLYDLSMEILKTKPLFDNSFSVEDTLSFYCTELVWHLYKKAINKDLTEKRRHKFPLFPPLI
ncbi:MAG: hypothetical protein WC984_09955, partial [Bacteroidales bacterium]